MHAFAGDDPGGHHFDPAELFGVDGALAVQRLADSRDHAAQNGLADGHLGDAAGPFDHVAFLDVNVFAHDGDTHVVLFEVEHQPQDVSRKLDELEGHHLLQTVHTGDAVTHRQHDAGFAQLDFLVIVRNLVLDNLTNFFCAQFH